MFDCLASQQSDKKINLNKEMKEKNGLMFMHTHKHYPLCLPSRPRPLLVIVKQHKHDSFTIVSEYNELILWHQSSKGPAIIFNLPANIPKYDN